jgi:hypothetical protein
MSNNSKDDPLRLLAGTPTPTTSTVGSSNSSSSSSSGGSVISQTGGIARTLSGSNPAPIGAGQDVVIAEALVLFNYDDEDDKTFTARKGDIGKSAFVGGCYCLLLFRNENFVNGSRCCAHGEKKIHPPTLANSQSSH